MFDEQTGWGTGMDGLFRTQDGGQSWQAVTPAEQQGSQYMPSAFFSSASAGWVLYPADLEGMTGVLYRTEDAGATWSQAPVEFPFAQLYFVDANSGWALNASDCGAGSCGGKLYRTHDGGITWETISYIEPDQPESAARIPFSGNKTGVTFADLNHGWVTGSIPMDGFVYLYETKDGGLTWQQQNLAVPPEYASGMMVTEPPRFFSPTDGILPAMVSGEQSVRIFFVTQDGGQTWTPMTPVSSGLFDFISLDQGWVWGEANLRMTVNRGQSWLEIPPNINLFTDLIQLDFVSPQAGWATTVDAEGKYTLYRTQDGGITWAP